MSFIKKIILLIALASPISSFAEHVTFYLPDSMPPFIYSSNGEPKGRLVSVLRAILAETGDTADIVMISSDIVSFNHYKYKGIVIGSLNYERVNDNDYTVPLISTPMSIVALKSKKFKFNSIADILDKTGGLSNGVNYGDTFNAMVLTGTAKSKIYPNQLFALRALLANQVDYVLLLNGEYGLQAILSADAELAENSRKLAVLDTPFMKANELRIMVDKSLEKKAFIERFNKALEKFKATPEYQDAIRIQ